MKLMRQIGIWGILFFVFSFSAAYNQIQFNTKLNQNSIFQNKTGRFIQLPHDETLKFRTVSGITVFPVTVKRTSRNSPQFSSIKIPVINQPTNVVTENFDKSQFPGEDWDVFDQKKSDSRNCFWGVDLKNRFSHRGNTVWCEAGGTSQGRDYYRYEKNLDSWMIYRPIDLSEANWGIVKFWFWLDSEVDRDFLMFLVSTNDTTYNGIKISGSYIDWHEIVLNLNDLSLFGECLGQKDVLFAWVFQSDNNDNQDTNDGAFIDSIEIKAAKLDTFNINLQVLAPAGVPAGLAWVENNLWLVDQGTDRIYKLDKFLFPMEKIDLSDQKPTGLAWNGTTLWSADSSTKMIYELDLTGNKLSKISAPRDYPFGLAWQKGTLWHTDTKSDTIYKWQGERWETVFPVLDCKLVTPTGIVWEHNHLWLADEATGLIYKIDEMGNPNHYFLSPAPYPRGLTFDGEYWWCVASDLLFKMKPDFTPTLSVTINTIDIHQFPNNTVWAEVKKGGSSIDDLQIDNFQLFEDGDVQQMDFIKHPNPFKFALALDNSSSMSEDETRCMLDGASQIIQNLQKNDLMTIIQFTSEFVELTDLINDTSKLNPALRTLKTTPKKPSTYLYNAMNYAILQLKNIPSPKAVIVFTDGEDSPTQTGKIGARTAQAVIDSAKQNCTPIFIVGLGNEVDRAAPRIASETGGLFYLASTADEINSIFNELSKRFHHNYQLGYQTAQRTFDGTSREVKVELNFKNDYGFATKTYIAPSEQPIMLEFPDTSKAPAGAHVPIPIFIKNIGSAQIYGINLTIKYDPNVLNFETVTLNSPLSQNWKIRNYNVKAQGNLTIALAGSVPISQEGKLFDIYFIVIGKVDQKTELILDSSMINEGLPLAYKNNGHFIVCKGFSLSGKLEYYNGDFPISNVKVILQKESKFEPFWKPLISMTDKLGKYSFKDIPWDSTSVQGQYEMIEKAVISTLDASIILQSLASDRPILKEYQYIAADVIGDSRITIDDAIEILNYCAGNPTKEQKVATWTFIPSDSIINEFTWSKAPRSYMYSPLLANKDNQNFKGIVYGDVTGNWKPPATQLDKASDSSPLLSYFNFNDLSRLAKNKARLKIRVQNMEAAQSFFLGFKYSAEAIKSIQMQVGEMLGDFMIRQNCEQGMFRIAGAGLNPVKGSGEFLVLNIELTDAAESNLENSLMLTEIQLDEKQVLLDQNLDLMGQPVELPTTFGLSPNFPNPFNLSTVIKYQLPEKSQVKIEVFNTLGQTIKVLVDKEIEAGYHQLTWNAEDEMGRVVPSGIYLYRMQAGSFQTVKKMTLFK